MNRNIELKASCSGLGAARQVAERVGARLHLIERQRDTYFSCEQGRLKLRERWPEFEEGAGGVDAEGGSPRAELIWYRRSDATQPRASDYTRVPVGDGEALRGVLAGALGVTVEVTKRRTVYLYHNVRIHLDEVDQLGTFIEFEAVIGPGDDEAESHARLEFLANEMGFTRGQIVGVSYSDLLR
jgi:adenylate cyclase, class 2